MLEEYGIVKSSKYELNKTMKYYSLTEKGAELIPAIIELWAWGAKFDPETTVAKEDLEQRLSNKEHVFEHLKAKALSK